MSTPTLDTIASEQLDLQLSVVEDRLAHDYTAVSSSSVHNLVQRERSRFADARIHVFVPILVERAVRATLAAPAKHRRD
ncbi:hypothetical protein VA596_11325 [Amycolatopsis sp., V23-08]|uniref:Uncharacterized protein n=1 Tax=Amycolatopsis heterodermiae TaxID=3110235 RepID=A0ABU5R343_9PSEU|nr:hypothetical protein [Amycolatopsis sp., V23-08]MEA5360129.1 hypothetical protein [Amycolatopsis sp., V23-08]